MPWGSKGCEEGSEVSIPLFIPRAQKNHRFIYSDIGWAVGAKESDFEGWAFPFSGVTLIEDFVTPEEEAELVQLMDRDPWRLSQSGRRKQVRPLGTSRWEDRGSDAGWQGSKVGQEPSCFSQPPIPPPFTSPS